MRRPKSMNLKITSIEEHLLDSIVAFCNLHYLNYQRYANRKDLLSQSIKVNNLGNDELIMLLTKILNKCDKYDFGTIQIM